MATRVWNLRAGFQKGDAEAIKISWIRHRPCCPDKRLIGTKSMTRRFVYLSGRCHFAAVAWMVAALGLAHAGDVPSVDEKAVIPGKPIAFDISSRSLDDALLAYGERTRYTALVDSTRTAGRRSGSATGVLTPEQALNEVLSGTGLVAQFSTPTAFALVPAPPPTRDESASEMSAQYRSYFAAIQSTIRRALCPHAETRPGSYRAALQIWIDGAGAIQRSEVIGSTDIPERDSRIEIMLLKAAIGVPPPGLPQPVTIVLTPRSTDPSLECVGIRAELR